MAVMLKMVTTKPSDTYFFSDVNPSVLDDFRKWQVYHEHVMGKHQTQVNSDTWEHVFIFETQELCSLYLSERNDHPAHKSITAHQAANGQTVVETVTII